MSTTPPKPRPLKAWSTAEDEFLLTIKRQGWDWARIARRFNCDESQCRTRWETLQENPPGPTAKGVDLKKPDGKTLHITEATLAGALAPMQRSVVEMGALYKALGGTIQTFNEYIAATVAEVELSELIAWLMKKPRLANESASEKLARLLCQNFIIIPKEIDDNANKTTPAGS